MKECTEIVCIIDRSGSMNEMKKEAIGGFNKFLDAQKVLPGEANISVVLFDDEYEMLAEGVKLADVPPLNDRTYTPRGTTALLDAVGRTIDAVGKRLADAKEEERPNKIVFMILTDGMENASKDYKGERIKEMIEHQKSKYAWDFVFMAANQDAFATGGKMGVARGSTLNYCATPDGTKMAFAAACNYVSRSRQGLDRSFDPTPDSSVAVAPPAPADSKAAPTPSACAPASKRRRKA